MQPDLSRRPRTKRVFSDADMARMRDLYYNRDVPMTRVADAFGVPVSTFLRWIAEMDWPRRTASGPGGSGRAMFGHVAPTPNPSPQGGGGAAPHPSPLPASGAAPSGSHRSQVYAGCVDLPASATSPAEAGEDKPLDPNELAYEVSAAARLELQGMDDVTGPMTLDERKRRADIIASLSRSIARIDRTFERRIERAKLQREIEDLRAKVWKHENAHVIEAQRLTFDAVRRHVERTRLR